MSKKIKRGGNSMFGRTKNNTWIKVLVWILVLGVLFYGGYYLGTALLKDRPEKKPESSETTDVSAGSVSKPQEEHASSAPETEKSDLILFCDAETMQDADKRSAFIRDAAKKKARAVAFTLKDADGKIRFRADNETAKKIKAVSPDALDAKALFAELKQAGLEGLPILYTFRDPLASSKQPQMAIWYNNGIENYLWLDDFADKGGKAWLNPYHPEAKAYILSLSAQLYEAGFQQLLFAGNEFGAAEGNTMAVYNEKSGSHMDEMKAFVKACEEQAAAHNAVCYFAESAQNLLIGSKKLGGNFLDTGAKHVAPVFALSRLSRNLKVDSETFKAPEEEPAAVTKALMAAYAKKAADTEWLPVFFDYRSIASLQAGVLEKGTPYLLVQSK